MLKKSQFTFAYKDTDQMLLYNAYNRKLVRTRHPKIEKVLADPNAFITEEYMLCSQLRRDGFLVDAAEDEGKKAQLAMFDFAADQMLRFTMMTTEACNFRCTYCYEKFDNGAMNAEVRRGFLQYLRKNLSAHKGLSINWFGGEPLMAMDVIEELSPQMIEMCQRRGIPYDASMTTNGYLLDLDRFRKLLSYRVTGFQITLDGPAEYHDKSRMLAGGGGTFDVIINNLRAIRDNIKSFTFKVLIRTNVTQESYTYLEEYIEFLSNEFGHDSRFSFYFYPVSDWGGENTQGKDEVAQPKMSDFLERVIDAGHTMDYSAYQGLFHQGMCIYGKRHAYVLSAQGHIYKCTILLDHHASHVGELTSDGRMELRLDKLAPWILPMAQRQECDTCYNSSRCGGESCAANKVRGQWGHCGQDVQDMAKVLRLLSKTSTADRIFLNYDEEEMTCTYPA